MIYFSIIISLISLSSFSLLHLQIFSHGDTEGLIPFLSHLLTPKVSDFLNLQIEG